MASVARVSDVRGPVQGRETTESGDGGSVLMGLAIGVAAAIAFGVFLWMAVH